MRQRSRVRVHAAPGLLAAVGVLAVAGCGGGSKGSGGSTPGTTTAPEVSSAPFAASVAESARTYDPADVVEHVAFGDTVAIDFTAVTARVSPGGAQEITPEGVTFPSATGGNVVVAKTATGVSVKSTVSGNVRYDLSGQLDGTLTLTSATAYQLYLNGVTINGTVGPALDLQSTRKVYVVTAPGTTNRLADVSSRSLTMKAALYGKGPMIYSGDGSLSVTGSYKHGIFSNGYIRVRGGRLDVAVSARDAVRSVNGFVFDDGRLTVTATGTTIDEESKGIKVEGSEATGTGLGFVVINGGTIDITSVGKAITAGWDIDEDATTATTSDDPDPFVEVNSGIITLTTTGAPYEYVSDGTTVSCSPEGIEAKTDLTINSGYLAITSTDDSLNAGRSVSVNGGFIYCASSSNDAIDSNGELAIRGGVLVAVGSTSPEGCFDSEQKRFSISGGTLVGIGGTTSRPTATQNTVVLGGRSLGKSLSIRAEDGTVAFSYVVPNTYATVVLSSPGLETGTRYAVITGGTVTAVASFKGLCLGQLGLVGGDEGTGFTVSSTVTKIGGVYF